MPGEIIGAFTYVTSDKKAYVRLVFDTTVYDFIDPTQENIKYRAERVDSNNIYNENLSWLYPVTNVSDLMILNGGKEISFMINNPFLHTRINFYSSPTTVRKHLVFDFVDNFYKQNRDNFVSVTTAGIIKVWLGTDNPRLPYRENLRGKIVNKENKVICIVGGYHVRAYPMNPYYFSEWTNTQINIDNGLDVYRRFLPTVAEDELPSNGEELFFVYELNGEVFYDTVYYDSSNGRFYKPIDSHAYEGWKILNDLI